MRLIFDTDRFLFRKLLIRYVFLYVVNIWNFASWTKSYLVHLSELTQEIRVLIFKMKGDGSEEFLLA